jgi:hypothetical protein
MGKKLCKLEREDREKRAEEGAKGFNCSGQFISSTLLSKSEIGRQDVFFQYFLKKRRR